MKVLLLRVLRTLMRRSEQPKRAKVFSYLLSCKRQYFPISLQSKYNALFIFFSFPSNDRAVRSVSSALHIVI